jgi:ABC-type sugar transport system ATPase subunit
LTVGTRGERGELELVSGLRRPDRGAVTLPSGKRVPHGLRNAIRAGVALVTGDRRRLGLMLDKPIWENIGRSTDIDELASLCDRVVVLHQGRVSAVLAGSALRTHAVLEAMNQGSNVSS